MATTKQKKAVSQEQLRRLMREKQYSAKTVAKKIEHPLAKYNSLDQIVCTLCQMVIKSDNLWAAHVQGVKHKEKYIASTTQGPAKPVEVGLKRKLVDEQLTFKKPKVVASGSNGFAVPHPPVSSSKTTGKMSALAEYSSSSEDESDDDDDNDDDSSTSMKPADPSPSNSSGTRGDLPPDFFDTSMNPDEDKAESTVTKPATMAEALPEGFFDDPKLDAKVRKVTYKDKMDEEWELFQRSMKEETHVSEAIIEEEDEQTNVERNLDEIDDQIQRWKEVEDLHIKKETITKTMGDDDAKEKESDDLDEDDVDQFLDWRSKKSWK